ncbi:MAG: hypothetical protein ITG01_00470 [Comamonas sp.]|nr:hypothetical protein [Comamonas sp.]
MKETGLMFKGSLVRAILEDRKTQTRRLVKPAPAADQLMLRGITTETGLVYARSIEQINSQNIRRIRWESPVGQPGDRIYVRETWSPDPPCDGTWCYTSWVGCRQGQIEGVPERFRNPEHCMYAASTNTDMVWTPSVHMPKWAARIWLEITGVRVERLQDIGEEDAKAEGAPLKNSPAAHLTSYRRGFQEVWESTGGDWADNPWVWVYDFKTISTTGRSA